MGSVKGQGRDHDGEVLGAGLEMEVGMLAARNAPLLVHDAPEHVPERTGGGPRKQYQQCAGIGNTDAAKDAAYDARCACLRVARTLP